MFFSFLRRALPCTGIVALCIAIGVMPPSVSAQDSPQQLTLSDAISFTLAKNPQLHQFSIKKEGLLGRRASSNLAPSLSLGLEVENIAGSGAYSGSQEAETTLSLSSVIELGKKRSTRMSVSNARLNTLEYQQQAFTLDVLGELTAVFIKTLEIQELLALAAEAHELAEHTLRIIKKRSRQGATPDSEVQRATAALAQAKLQLDALQYAHQRNMMQLAAYWGEPSPAWQRLQGDLFSHDAMADYSSLYQRALSSPAIEIFASKERLKTAELNLAKAQSKLDINWQLGVRRFEQSGDSAFSVGMSVPLFSGRRNRGEVTAALTERDEVAYQRQSALQQLHLQLYTAHSQHQQHVNAVGVFQRSIIPSLSTALKATQDAYEIGRYSYQDWVAAQTELLSAKQNLIESAAAASLNQAAIEQLIAEPLKR